MPPPVKIRDFAFATMILLIVTPHPTLAQGKNQRERTSEMLPGVRNGKSPAAIIPQLPARAQGKRLKPLQAPIALSGNRFCPDTIVIFSLEHGIYRHRYTYGVNSERTSDTEEHQSDGTWSLFNRTTWHGPTADGTEETILEQVHDGIIEKSVTVSKHDAISHTDTTTEFAEVDGVLIGQDRFIGVPAGPSGDARTYQIWIDGGWVNTGRSTQVRDAERPGSLSALDESWSGTEWVPVSRFLSSGEIWLDPITYIDTSLSQVWNNGSWQNVSRDSIIVVFDTTLRAESVQWTWRQDVWKVTRTLTYGQMFDDSGHLAYFTYQCAIDSLTGECNREGARQTEVYDLFGNVTERLYDYLFEGKWTKSVRISFVYDSHENCTSVLWTTWDGLQWVPADGVVSTGDVAFPGYQMDITYPSPIATFIAHQSANPDEYRLEQNYPNPFNPTTEIRYRLLTASFVTLKVHDLLGRDVATLVNEAKQAGVYSILFDAGDLASGTYFYSFTVGGFAQTRKMILLR